MAVPRREAIATAVPGIVAAVGSMFWLSGGNIGSRLLLAGFSGFVLYGIGIFAYVLAGYVVVKVSGREREATTFVQNDARTAAAGLVFVGMWFLGQHWVRAREQDLLKCVSVQQRDGDIVVNGVTLRQSHRDVVETCLADNPASETVDD